MAITIKVAYEYSKTPGGRTRKDGPYSGEDFRETILIPKYIEAKEKGEQLIVDLDGGYGYGTSFLEEAFGGMARKLGDKELRKIVIISDEEPKLAEDVSYYIDSALKEK